MDQPGKLMTRASRSTDKVPGIVAAAIGFLSSGAGVAAPVLMISIDGLKPEYVLEADAHGLKVPFLRRQVAEGAYARGVIGVWPTVTYPSHTTLMTGVTPAEHGIWTNVEFDPMHQFKESWFWYAKQIRVPTLWDVVHAAGRGTSSIGWPVTVGDTSIDYLIPEYWRLSGPTDTLNPTDRNLIDALARPEGLITQMQTAAGAYLMGNDTSLSGDAIKARYAGDILRKHAPLFMTLHLSSLDDAQHAHGVFSPEANADLEAIDLQLSQLAEAARAKDPASIVAVVSDHGFVNLTHWVNLSMPFRQAGLYEENKDPLTGAVKISTWKAQPWVSGGMAAIMLHDAADLQTAHLVGELLKKLAADPQNGIAAIKDRNEMAKLGAFPGAAYLVVFKPGYYAVANTNAFITEVAATHGGHGFSPEFPEMRSSFFIAGTGVAHHRDLGVIDMRQIAPSIAAILGVSMPTARAVPLKLSP